LKRRFHILRTNSEYSIQTQSRLIYAVTALHNFITEWEGLEDYEEDQQAEEKDESGTEEEDQEPCSASVGSRRMNAFRDEIAEAMWQDYQNRIQI
jgi:hypothetical protein